MPLIHPLSDDVIIEHLVLLTFLTDLGYKLGDGGDGSPLAPDHDEVQHLITSPVHSPLAGVQKGYSIVQVRSVHKNR